MWRKWIHLERILKLRKIKITKGINPKKEKKSQSIMKKDPFYRILSFTLKGNLLKRASLEILDVAQIELMLVWWLRCSAPRHRETVAKPLAQTQTTLHNQSKIWLSLQNIFLAFSFCLCKKNRDEHFWMFANYALYHAPSLEIKFPLTCENHPCPSVVVYDIFFLQP